MGIMNIYTHLSFFPVFRRTRGGQQVVGALQEVQTHARTRSSTHTHHRPGYQIIWAGTKGCQETMHPIDTVGRPHPALGFSRVCPHTTNPMAWRWWRGRMWWSRLVFAESPTGCDSLMGSLPCPPLHRLFLIALRAGDVSLRRRVSSVSCWKFNICPL